MKNRNPWIAAILNAVVLGLGHLYVGRARRALVVIVPFALVFAVLALSHQLSNVEVYLGLFVAAVSIKVLLMIDAFIMAWKHPQPEPRWYMNIRAYAGYVIVLLLINAVFMFQSRLFGYETYSISRDAMAPTLLEGEYVTVDTFAYRNRAVAVDDIVSILTPAKVRLIRRVKTVGETQIESISDRSEVTITFPKESVDGRVTGIVFSSDLSRIGQKIPASKPN